MKIEKIETLKCKYCGSYKMTMVGQTAFSPQGYFCEKHHYNRADGRVFRIKDFIRHALHTKGSLYLQEHGLTLDIKNPLI